MSIRTRLDGSTQWMSSMTTTSGPRATSRLTQRWVTNRTPIWNSAGSVSPVQPASQPSSGSRSISESRASTAIAPNSSRADSGSRSWATPSPNISSRLAIPAVTPWLSPTQSTMLRTVRYGDSIPCGVLSTHIQPNPAALASSSISQSSRDLPTPGSPRSRMAPPRPVSAVRRTISTMRSFSAPRPMSGATLRQGWLSTRLAARSRATETGWRWPRSRRSPSRSTPMRGSAADAVASSSRMTLGSASC